MDPIQTIFKDLKTLALKPNRIKGQNFLVSGKVRKKIVQNSNVSSSDTIIEIGPGTGILSWKLIQCVSKYIMLEIESDLVQLLKDRFSKYQHVSIYKTDAIFWLKEHIKNLPSGTKLISNLPYHLCSPIIIFLAEHARLFGESVLLVQKEFADRAAAEIRGSQRCALSVLCQARLCITYIGDVPSRAFYPRPDVRSAIIKLIPREDIPGVDWELFKKVIYLSFHLKRKTLRNNLKVLLNDQEIEDLFKSQGFDSKIRAEMLSVNDFVKLANRLQEMGKREDIECWKPFY